MGENCPDCTLSIHGYFMIGYLTDHSSTLGLRMIFRTSQSTALRAFTLAIAAISSTTGISAQDVPSPAATVPATVEAQPLPEDRGANGLWQDLQRLHIWASMMMIVAHPDDEDGGMLTYESRGLGVRTSLLTLNRGEGGQNVMSSDDDDALGLIRTNELLKADQYYGVDQYWGRVADYGFSKTIEEAFQQWGHERVLYDVVRAVRLNRPLVITASFIGGITDGHGQHQVSGEIAQEVFTAAGDPKVFPDQIKAGLRPWSPLKVYARVPRAGVTFTAPVPKSRLTHASVMMGISRPTSG